MWTYNTYHFCVQLAVCTWLCVQQVIIESCAGHPKGSTHLLLSWVPQNKARDHVLIARTQSIAGLTYHVFNENICLIKENIHSSNYLISYYIIARYKVSSMSNKNIYSYIHWDTILCNKESWSCLSQNQDWSSTYRKCHCHHKYYLCGI